MKNVNHIVWADLIRVIAILMVICIHCSDPFNVSPEARLNPEYNLWGSIYGAFSCGFNNLEATLAFWEASFKCTTGA